MSGKRKVPIEKKMEAIRRYRSDEVTMQEAARMCGVHFETMNTWVRNYENEGIDAFLNKNQKVYSEAMKHAAVEMYVRGEASVAEICKNYKIRSRETLRRWIMVYNGGGDLRSVRHSGGGSYMKQGRSTTQEERIEIVKDCLANGKNYGEMALKYQVSYQQVRTWTKRYEELGVAGLEDRRGKRKKDQEPRTELEKAQIEIERLKHRLYMAELERDLLKKLDEIERREANRK